MTPLTHDCMIQPPDCSTNGAYVDFGGQSHYVETDCGHQGSAKVYFVSYALIMLFIVIEMFVNVIMEKFEQQAELADLPVLPFVAFPLPFHCPSLPFVAFP